MTTLVDSKVASRCILVLGMHRSGTSTATRCLNLVGMDVGPHLLAPDGGNSKGYWEHADAVRINDGLLEALGLSWWSLDPLPAGWLTSPQATIARKEIEVLVRRDFAGIPLWGIKDPRMCRLAPLWIDVVRGMGIDVSAVFVIRSPHEVARSLSKAHGLTEEASVLSWAQYTAESECATRHLRRAMVSYDRVLSEPAAMLEDIGRALDISWPVAPMERRGALEAFVDSGLRTHSGEGGSENVPTPVVRLEEACERLAAAKGEVDWSQFSLLCDETIELLDVLAYRTRAQLPDEMAWMHQLNEAKREQAHAVFYRAGSGEEFSDQSSVAHPVFFRRTQIEFKLADGAYERQRLDPADRAGYYLIFALNVVDADGTVVWNWGDAPDEVTFVGIERINCPGRLDAHLYRFNEDPQIHLAWSLDRVHFGQTLILDIERLDDQRLALELDEWRDAAEQSERLLREQLRVAHAEKIASVEILEQLVAARSDAEGLKQQLVMLQQEAKAQAHRGLVAARGDADALKQQLLMLQQEAEAQAHRGSVLQHQLTISAAEVETLKKGLLHQSEMMRTLLRRGLWSSLRRRLARTEFRLLPKQHIEVLDASARSFRVTGDDPIFDCESDNYPLAPGWYLVTLHMEQHAGPPAQPCLYPDYGPDTLCAPAGEGMLFVRSGRSVHRGLVRFTHPVRALRFDPATGPCELSLSKLVVKRVSKLRAAWQLAKAWRRPMDSVGKLRPAWRSILSNFRSMGISGGVDGLYRWYTVGDPRKHSYDAWLASFDDISPTEMRVARARSSNWSYRPLISILVPTYNTDEQWLRSCLDSVLSQAYPNWELCIADDASPKAHVMRVLNEYAARDKRIRVERRSANGHISASSNTALQMATGEYVALLDHDDELHPLALDAVVGALQRHPQWKLIYSDEDKLDQHGHRYDPYMKPDWNYDLLLSQNFISHLGVYQRQLVMNVGGFREGYEGSQDWDLVLRCVEKLSAEEIGHIPRVLYHWRAIPGSTAVGVGEKSYARTAALKAITEHLKRVGMDATVREHGHPKLKGQFHVRYRLPAKLPKISLIIPTRDGLHLLKRCVDSILTLTDYDNYEIVIVNNQSSEVETQQYLEQVIADSRVRVLDYDQPFNYSALNNYAARRTSGEIIGLVNNDIEVISSDWLLEMAGHVMRTDIGAVGAKLYYPNNTIQHAGVVLGLGGVAGHVYCGEPRGYLGQMGRAQLTQNLSAVTAACLLIRRSVFEEAGGLDESLRVAFNDIDFCLRVRRLGYRNLWTPFAELYHHESATRGYEDSPEKQARFAGEVERMRELWGSELDADPAYSPNLTLTATPFELAFPPRTSG
jgi:O-antigen biosynthesis protein